ncbi:hypothetical protein DAEQUDRAFT_762904 [Daedalea quercina L-15889]|uniref:Uncharacterized protein n=1 Tax=Daedalea quercina L-15889 TaxID=1314783 RepID=A0A165SXF2_9APHY|nr:hypothetical protein DAEQUDRAFT_762904 [Daedalea quercina L-15889]
MRKASSVLATSLRRAYQSKRSVSNSSSAGKRPTAPVPRERLRALVELYHEADLFVTPSNLSSTIDHEFIHKHSEGIGIGRGDEDGYRDLQAQYRKMKDLPKYGDSRVAQHHVDEDKRGSWSDSRPERETRVLRALFGLDVGRRPGLEVLEEERDRVMTQIIEPDSHVFKKS